MSYRDPLDELMEIKEKTRKVEMDLNRAKEKGLDHLLAYSGDNPKMDTLEGLRNWWLTFKLIGMRDPPNKDMEFLGHYKVQQLEWGMSKHVAKAEAFLGETIDHRRPVYSEVAQEQPLPGLDDIE